MKLLQKAANKQAFAKVGFLGFQGSGKTHTAMLIAIGLAQRIGAKRIAFFDTETGSDWWVSRIPAGIEFYQVKSRAFTDLLETISECEREGVPILVIDSITHVWRDLTDSYMRKLNRKRLQFQDWQIIKSEWGRYTDAFVNSRVHIIVCGRAGYEYDYELNEDGTKDLVKTGTKMKAESEFGFEPSLVIEMERVTESQEELEKLNTREQRQGFRPKIGAKVIHRAHVLKDRSDTLDGQSFDNPTFETFESHFKWLNLGGEHLGVDTSRTSEGLFSLDGDNAWRAEQKAREVALDEIQAELTRIFPGQSAQEKKAKLDILEAVFGTRSWAKVSEQLKSPELQAGLKKIRWLLLECDKEKRNEAILAGMTADGKVLDPQAACKAIAELLKSAETGGGNAQA